MGKITVKHFLNTNLKAYTVRGVEYYTVYLLITVNRKSTQVKSHSFAEMHSEADFNKYLKKGHENYIHFELEEQRVQKLIETQIFVFGDEFDTLLFSAFYNLMPEYHLNKAVLAKELLEVLLKKRIIRDSGSLLFLDFGKEAGVTFYDWFDPQYQKKVLKEIIGKDKVKKQLILNRINASVICSFFDILDIVVMSSQKYRSLKSKYPISFDDSRPRTLGSW